MFYLQNLNPNSKIALKLSNYHKLVTINKCNAIIIIIITFTVKVLLIVLNNGAIGIVTAMFLRSLNSILKTFASALELMFTAVLSWFLFGIPVNVLTAVAIAIVSYATLLYAQNPVDNTKPVNDKEESDSKV